MAGVTGSTLVDVFADRAKATPDAVAFRTKLGGVWTTITYGRAEFHVPASWPVISRSRTS